MLADGGAFWYRILRTRNVALFAFYDKVRLVTLSD